LAKYIKADTFFSQADSNASYYDSFFCYKTLSCITSNHMGVFICQNIIETLGAVYAETNDLVLFKKRALEVNMPERTTTNTLANVTNGTISARSKFHGLHGDT